MKTAMIIAAVLSATALLSGAENRMKKPETTCKVDPGTWNEAAGKSEKLARLIDRDRDPETGKRKGLLADGKEFQPLASGAEWGKGGNAYVKVAGFNGEWNDCRFVRFKVYTTSSGINVTEIYGK